MEAYFCSRCGEFGVKELCRVEPRLETHRIFNRKDYTVISLVRKCCLCGDDLFDPDLDDRSIRRAYEVFKEETGFSVEEIRDMIKRCDLFDSDSQWHL